MTSNKHTNGLNYEKSEQSENSRKPEQIPTWADNWILLRDLWPDWEPTKEMVKEVWFRSFDKPHGIKGEARTNQRALRKAIITVRKCCIRKEPQFMDVADNYRLNKNEEIVTHERYERLATEPEKERKQVEGERAKRLAIISGWSSERINAARDRVSQSVPSFSSKSADMSTWSATYAGMIFAADEMIGKND